MLVYFTQKEEVSMPELQQEAKNFDIDERRHTQEHEQMVTLKRTAEFERIVSRFYEGDLSGERVQECIKAFKELVPIGRHVNPKKVSVVVTDICLHDVRPRARDCFVKYLDEEGRRQAKPIEQFYVRDEFRIVHRDAASL